ncbi:bifunctional DNA primase/polymerase [Streptomyces luteireticuli]|uniref:bifunctional DNA primase/polymerase n=1 Tax=Streptomyces luteireticuli TaxID=173858 RepID=UPI0035568528
MTEPLATDLGSLPLLASALDAAERGWPVIPLRPGAKSPAGHSEQRCPRTGRCSDGHLKPEQRATTDPSLIHAAWARGRWNVGIATGPAGLLVIDLDVPKPGNTERAPSGTDSWQALCERAGTRPVTRQVRTPSGGEHWYFTTPPGTRLGCTVGQLGPRIDTRAWGGYVVAPGSTTPNGAYTVLGDHEPAPLPDWLHNALTPPPRPGHAVPDALRNRGGYAAAALRAEERNVATAADGTRNATLLRAARALGRLVASGDLTRNEVEEALSRGAGANATQPQRYYDDVIARGLDWSIAHNPNRGRAA